MAAVDDDWTVEQIGPPENQVRMELGEDDDTDLVRLHRGEETVTFRVDDDIAVSNGDIPEWAAHVAHRLGIDRVVGP